MTQSAKKKLTKDNPEFTPTIARGVRLLRDKQIAPARACFAQAVRSDPANATAWYWLSRTVDGPRRQDCLDRMRLLDEKTSSIKRQDQNDAIHNTQYAARNPLPPLRRTLSILTATLLFALCMAIPLFTPPARAQIGTGQTRITTSGLMRAETVLIASEYGGLIRDIPVQEGAVVRAGEVLVQLDTSTIDTQVAVAQAAIDLAEAALAQARAGVRPGQIAIAEAQLAQAEAGRLAAAQAVTDTLLLARNPQELRLYVAVAETQIASLEHKLAQALAYKDAAQVGKEGFEKAMEALNEIGGPGSKQFRVLVAEGSWQEIIDRLPPEVREQLPNVPADGVYTFGDIEIEVQSGTFRLYRWVTVDVNVPFEAHLAPNLWWQAWVGVNAAAAQKEGAQAALEQLVAQLNNPQTLLSQADQAAAALAQANAQVLAAQAQVSGLKAGASREQIAALEAQVAQARAALTALQTQRAQMTLTAPVDGIVVALTAHPGEIAAQGATLITLADLYQMQLTVYLPATQIGLIKLGDPAQISVDSFAGQTFAGIVAHIADTAQFTPRNVATQEERANLVFGVEIHLDNPDGALKPGMPADVVLGN
ncbi:MAG: efflux RND transporter periplasmic adaptor subunit [Anaerolineae bacterium]|nr:efflux RND transporter periplasmic adaptor subunit [Anaerolineae bacterium]